jgi:phenylacetic acid degradation operon negative regulatory protein
MTRRAPAAAAALVSRFRRQRPLRAGSLLVTIFGDSITPLGGVVTLASLIRLAAPFGVSERLVRTSVARLAQDGWLASRRDGRLSEYRLTESGRERFAAATRRIYSSNPTTWTGTWTLALLPAGATGRGELRTQLRWLGFGQIEPGVLVHATLGVAETRSACARLPGGERVLVFAANGQDPAVDRRLARGGWELATLAARYRRFIAAFSPLRAALDQPAALDPESALIVRTLLLHEFRKVHLRDPLLPEPLLPMDWAGTAAYELCRELYARVFHAAQAHLGAHARRLRGPLPALDPATYARFGGLPRTSQSTSVPPESGASVHFPDHRLT